MSVCLLVHSRNLNNRPAQFGHVARFAYLSAAGDQSNALWMVVSCASVAPDGVGGWGVRGH